MNCDNCGREVGRRAHIRQPGYCVLAPMERSDPARQLYNCHGGPLDGAQLQRQGDENAVGDDTGHYWLVSHTGGDTAIRFRWWEWRFGLPVSNAAVRHVTDWRAA